MPLGLPTLRATRRHVYNHVFIRTPTATGCGRATRATWCSARTILIIVGWFVASKVQTGPESRGTDRYTSPGTSSHFYGRGIICVYLREGVARPLLGDRTNKLMPFLRTLFFILVNNLLGLVPILIWSIWFRRSSRPATRRPSAARRHRTSGFTTTLQAVISGLFFSLVAIRHLGIGGYFAW